MSVDEDKNIGQQFGNYRLVRRLGSGGFASVYLGQHVFIAAQQAAVKILHLFDVNTQNFQQEAETTAALVHPHIVRLFDFDLHQGKPFLVMDYAPHGSLRYRHPKGTVIPLATVVQYVKEIAPALQYAHDHNIIHRDVKPENVLIGLHNELLLSDFGIALLSKTGRTLLQNTNNVGGTPEYMAPEMFSGKPEKASDQYSLGIVVYEWLCGTPPYSEGNFIQLGYQHNHVPIPSLHEKLPELASSVEAVVMKALAKDHQQRFASVQKFAEELEKASRPPIRLESVRVAETLPLQQEAVPLKQALRQGNPRVVPLVAPVAYPSSNSTRTRGFTRTRAALLALILFLVFMGSIVWLVPTANTYFTTIHATATADAHGTAIINGHITATAEVRATVTAAAQAYATAVATNGIMFGFDAQHTRVNPYEKILNPQNVSQLTLEWVSSTGNAYYPNDSSPAITNGVVYVGSHDKKLYAFDAVTGHTRWVSSPIGGVIDSSPTVANGVVYIGSYDRKLYAFDATTGHTLWVSFPTGDAIFSSPTVANGVVYIGSYDRKLYAFHLPGTTP